MNVIAAKAGTPSPAPKTPGPSSKAPISQDGPQIDEMLGGAATGTLFLFGGEALGMEIGSRLGWALGTGSLAMAEGATVFHTLLGFTLAILGGAAGAVTIGALGAVGGYVLGSRMVRNGKSGEPS